MRNSKRLILSSQSLTASSFSGRFAGLTFSPLIFAFLREKNFSLPPDKIPVFLQQSLKLAYQKMFCQCLVELEIALCYNAFNMGMQIYGG
jgi:hypothetical protein